MQLRLMAIDLAAGGALVQLPKTITSYQQVKPLEFNEGTLWVVLLEPSE